MENIDRERFMGLLKDSVITLCRSGFLSSVASVEGLLGITMENNEVFLINIKEVLKQRLSTVSDRESYSDSPVTSKDGVKRHRHSRRKRKHSLDTPSPDIELVEASLDSLSQNTEFPSFVEATTETSTLEQFSNSDIDPHRPSETLRHHEPASTYPSRGESSFHETHQNYDADQFKVQIKREPEEYYPNETDACYGDRLSSSEMNFAKSTDFTGIMPPEHTEGMIQPSSLIHHHDHHQQQQQFQGKMEEAGEAASQVDEELSLDASNDHTAFHSLGTEHIPNPHVCRQCGKVYRWRQALRRHERAHKGIIYKCPHCSRTFLEQCRLRDHLRGAHGTGFKCPYCPTAVYKQRWDLLKHMKANHSDQPASTSMVDYIIHDGEPLLLPGEDTPAGLDVSAVGIDEDHGDYSSVDETAECNPQTSLNVNTDGQKIN